MARTVCLTAAALIALVTRTAGAQGVDDKRAHADALFNEGQQLLSAGQTQAACEKLEESQRVDPKLGRLLNVAYCHEQLGKTATAWSEYNQAVAVALQSHQAERETFARGRAKELAAKLSFVRLEMQPGAEITGLTVDGRPISRDQWNVPFPIDPGSHELSFSASGHVTRTETVKVADTETVKVPVAPLEAGSSAPAAPAAAAPAPAAAPTPTTASVASAPPPTEGSHSHPLRIAGFVVGGLGVVGLGVGAGFGLHALSLQHDADSMCPGKRCTPQGTKDINDATSAANISTLGFVVGAVAVAAGVVLVIDPFSSSASSTPSARLAPFFASDRAGMAMEGTW
jgi:hypothetical protein